MHVINKNLNTEDIAYLKNLKEKAKNIDIKV